MTAVCHGFGVPQIYSRCERLDIQYTVGIGMNARLKRLSEPLLEEAVQRWEATGQSQRLVCAFWYRAKSWPAQRWIVIKCEANSQGTNRRAVVTNRRRQWHNRRREHDPLGEGQPCTWRTRLIKVGARVVETTRRVIVQLSSGWPYLNHDPQVALQILRPSQPSFDTS